MLSGRVFKHMIPASLWMWPYRVYLLYSMQADVLAVSVLR